MTEVLNKQPEASAKTGALVVGSPPSSRTSRQRSGRHGRALEEAFISSRSSQHLNKLPLEPGVCLCLVGVHCSSKISLSVQANLYLLGKCVLVYVDVCVCVCGCVGVFVCVQNKIRNRAGT